MAPVSSGQQYSRAEPGEEVCITGIAGYFPKSDSVAEFRDNLFDKADLISDLTELWQARDVEAPPRAGKMKELNRFDAGFFGIDFEVAQRIDPMQRLLLERTYEAIIDAGVNPTELKNTKTGVYLASCFIDSETTIMADSLQNNHYALIGSGRAMVAERISEWLGLKGPAYSLDAACSSSMHMFNQAFKAIRDGRCDAAIICGSNLVLHYEFYLQASRLGLLSLDGKCKCFDESANGYVRSEAAVVCFLQKSKDARRVHAQLVHVRTNCDGYKEQDITFPSSVMQAQLLRDFYQECDISPDKLEYMECHCTGTAVGDPEEVAAVDEVICTRRSKPLLVGSVKSNMGHGEPTAAMCSLAKICIAYNTGYIPPNVNLTELRGRSPALTEGRLKVVTDKLPWNCGLVAINSFGFGGSNGHCLLKNIARNKVNNGKPLDSLPRIVCVSGRTQSAVLRILRDLSSRVVDVEEIRLWHAIHERNIHGHNYRGFVVLESSQNNTVSLAQEIQKHPILPNKVCFHYPSLGVPIRDISMYMQIPTFAAVIQKCHGVLEKEGLDLMNLFSKYNPLKRNATDIILVVASQIAITDVLKKMAIEPDYVIGSALGDLCSAYADNCLTGDQTVLIAYRLFMSLKDDTEFQKDDTIFATKIAILESALVDQHHRQPAILTHTGNKLRDLLVEAISKTRRSKRWLGGTSDPVNLSVLHNEKQVNFNTIVIGITSVCSLQENNLQQGISYVPIFEDGDHGCVDHFLLSWGKLFMSGLNPQLAHLYPPVQFPVSQETPLLSHLVEWNHSEDWNVVPKILANKTEYERRVTVSFDNQKTTYLKDHSVDGRVFYPASGYLALVWETLALTIPTTCDELSVVFEDVRWQRATLLSDGKRVEFIITLHRVTGEFEIVENTTTVVTGRVYAKKDIGESLDELPKDMNDLRMNSKDFYKEMVIRGYGYRSIFQGIVESNLEITHSRVSWLSNWVAFLDTFFQIKILSENSRCIHLPTRLERLCIDTDLHFDDIKKNTNRYVDIFRDMNVNLIRSAGVEVRGLHFDVMQKKITSSLPVKRSYEFVPYFGNGKSKMEDVLNIYVQIIHENMPTIMFKGIEMFDEVYKLKYKKQVAPVIHEVINKIPDTIADIDVIFNSNEPPTLDYIKKNINKSAVVVIGADLLTRPHALDHYKSYLLKGGFIISREQFRPQTENNTFKIIAIHDIGTEHLVLLRRNTVNKENYLKISMIDEYSWVDEVKDKLGKSKLILYTQNEANNGLIGFAKSLVRQSGEWIVSVFMIDDEEAPLFNPTLEFYRKQIDKNIVCNVFKNGQWGSYRNVPVKEVDQVLCAHVYNNLEHVGDLSTLRWYKGPLNDDVVNTNIVHVYYSALNCRDVMIATGRLHIDNEYSNEAKKYNTLGFEVAGRTVNGSRVMCMPYGGVSNKVVCGDFVLPIPDEWTLEEACTVPVAYATVYTSLIIKGKLKFGERVLIHSGAGGVGQAAINVALHYDCEVFTTVGSQEQRDIVKKLFPRLKDSHIACSLDTTFETVVQRETKGEGVDIVLNSLTGDKLLASIRCLAYRGRFLQIGRDAVVRNTLVDSGCHLKEISYHSISYDHPENMPKHAKQRLLELMMDGVASGAVQPLTRCIFDTDHVESAYRYMVGDKHIGKVLIKIREESAKDSAKPTPLFMNGIPRYTFNPSNVLVIVGGLGGVGMELVQWLVARGASRLLLVSARGITNGYQEYRLRIWHSCGVDVRICTHDVSTEEGCQKILTQANSMGTVEAIFNLAAVLKDALFQDQTRESFAICCRPKAHGAIHLDKLSRRMCPRLKSFVMFSSQVCSIGNAGQSNYGFANSVLDRICERRKREGLPALSIQWGLIGEVGIIASMIQNNEKFMLNGMGIQSISSCLHTLDEWLTKEVAVVTSVLIEEKKKSAPDKLSLVETVARIKGIQDIKAISHQATLNELGLDSIMAVEIMQAFERNFDIFLTPGQVRKLTFASFISVDSDDIQSGEAELNLCDIASDNGGGFIYELFCNKHVQ